MSEATQTATEFQVGDRIRVSSKRSPAYAREGLVKDLADVERKGIGCEMEPVRPDALKQYFHPSHIEKI